MDIFGEKWIPSAMVASLVPSVKLIVLSGSSRSCRLTIPEGICSILVNATMFSLNSSTP